MAGIETMVQNMQEFGFAYLIPWFLALAVSYGILEHYKMPKSVSARGVISLAISFMVLFVGKSIYPFLQSLATSLIVIAVGIIMIVILTETMGIKAGGGKSIFEEHSREFSLVVIILGVLVFISAGGADLLGLSMKISNATLSILLFLAIIVIGVWWISSSSEEK